VVADARLTVLWWIVNLVFEELIWVARRLSVHAKAVCPPSGRAKLYLEEGFIFFEKKKLKKMMMRAFGLHKTAPAFLPKKSPSPEFASGGHDGRPKFLAWMDHTRVWGLSSSKTLVACEEIAFFSYRKLKTDAPTGPVMNRVLGWPAC
jgi:hypothetical protein